MSDDNGNNVYLILGCFGLIDGGFVSCSACENPILRIHPGLENYSQIMDYLDACRLFDKPCFDCNAIKNIIQNIHVKYDSVISQRRAWKENDLNKYQKFILNHRLCGLYLNLSLEQKGNIQPEEKEVPIVGTKIISAPKMRLKLVKGKNE